MLGLSGAAESDSVQDAAAELSIGAGAVQEDPPVRARARRRGRVNSRVPEPEAVEIVRCRIRCVQKRLALRTHLDRANLAFWTTGHGEDL